MYQNVYELTMTFKNPQYRSKLSDSVVQKQIQAVVTRLNSYYQNATKRQVSLKKYLEISFVNGEIFITLKTENPLPNPERKGQCMRQFSRFLLEDGFGQFLTAYDPKKLLSS
ncbi:hypothetical protein [Paenibacillus sp. JJ-223]|uniref:hypothetical protein n=1 Tax=Paenibacillus sp. JJ-223 TaxID=2905647 RepID=UPI001F2E004E|nr:hypothetical protein [Paenibacillus sp. JJ-223]CAH1203045.1 hypothetical protein PAECIP111890_02121 [Paenibacillus sp. JJ-223]